MLVAEPDRLTRWSIEAYFRTRYSVLSASNIHEVRDILKSRPIDALVISDEFPEAEIDAIQALARSRNARIVILRTVTDPARRRTVAGDGTLLIEKPFKLSALALMLGGQSTQEH